MRINFELLDIRAFLSVLATGSFRGAAKELNLSQPALSRRIKMLEQTFGSPLLERTTRHVAPTTVGRQLQPMFLRMVDEVESTILAVSDTGRRQSGQVTIACVPTAAFYFLPQVIRLFNKQHPLIRFRIHDLSAREGLESVARGETEFGINMLGHSETDLRFTPLMKDPFVLACRRDHPLAKRRSLKWAELTGYPLVGVSRHSGNRTILDNALAAAKIELNWFYEVNHLSTSLGLVEPGLGISVLPRLATPQGKHPLIVAIPIKDPVVTRTIGIVERRSGHLSPAAGRFRDMLVDSWRRASSKA
jgi:DNA-binding transcriptional LysR family regulator